MIFIKIINWKELVLMFGLTNQSEGLLTAKELSSQLRKDVASKGNINHAIECNRKSEAVALFKYIEAVNNEICYEYLGTAN